MLREIKVQDGQNIEDICVLTYGSTEYLTELLSMNGLTFDSDVTGLTLVWDDSLSYNVPSSIDSGKINTTSSILSWVGFDGQTMYDVALQTQTTLESIVKLSLDNNISLNSINDVKGRIINYSKLNIKDYALYNFIANIKTGISSSITIVSGKAFNKSFNMSFH